MEKDKNNLKKQTEFLSGQTGAFLSKNIAGTTDEALSGMNLLRQESVRMVKVLTDKKQGNLFEIIERTKFNMDAASKGSNLRAVTTAELGDPHAAADILIKNGNKTVREVQAKSSNKAANALHEMNNEKYHGMQKLFNSDKVNKARELAQKRADSGSIYSKEYQDTVKNATGELKHGNVHSGGTTHGEAMSAANDATTYARNFEMEQFKKEIGVSTLNATVAGGVLGGSVSVITNAFKLNKGEIDGGEFLGNVAKDTSKAATKSGAAGALGSGMRIIAQKAGSISLSKTNVATAIASSVIESGVTIFKYIKGEIDEYETMTTLGETGVSTMSSIYAGVVAGAFFGPIGALVGSMAGFLIGSNVYQSCISIFKNSELKIEEYRRIIKIYDESIVIMQQQRKQMESYFQNRFSKNQKVFDSFFIRYEDSLKNESYSTCIESMNQFALYFGKELKYANFDKFDEAMKSDDPLIL